MADRGAMTVTPVGPGQFLATSQITDVATDDYVTIDVPGKLPGATVVALDVNLTTPGSAATVQPVVNSSASTTAPQLQVADAAARAYVEPRSSVRVGNDGRLYLYPVPNVAGGQTSVVTLEARIALGWCCCG